MRKLDHLNSLLSVLALVLISFTTLNAQEDSEILDSYEEYTEAAREVVYLQLNKSTYVKGEDIGFTAYVLDKKDKKPSLLTTNLYVSIEDEDNKILTQKLIKVFDGVASNTFEVDSVFSTGFYKIKAYTNWMLNFNEHNYYTETIRIIHEDDDTQADKIDQKIDAQFLPESGHLLQGVTNTIGVTIKDQLGFGIPFANGEVVDKNNTILSTFKTNQFGIGRFQLLPENDDSYAVKINNIDEKFSISLNHAVERKGVILSLKKLKSKLFISLITNEETLESIKDSRYTLMLHNGDLFEIMDMYFNDELEITKTIDISNTATGINILTLFNENDQPIAERLFFNYEGINLIKPSTITTTTEKDSLEIKLNFKDVNPNINNSISISILPKDSKSYNRHNNIMSHTYLEPYVNGTIEQGKYYFTEMDSKKEYELDNLLITQGWSSYNWNEIFQNTQNLKYPFEQGITINANTTTKDNDSDTKYIAHAINNESPQFFSVKKGEKSFVIENLFPIEDESLHLSKITKNDGLEPTSLYLQFFPNKIPTLKNYKNELPYYSKQSPKLISTDYNISDMLIISSNVQRLKEVVVTNSPGSEKRLKQNELSRGRYGKITVVSEQDRSIYVTLLDYINYKIFSGNEFSTSGRLDLKGIGKTSDPEEQQGNEIKSPASKTYAYFDQLSFYLDDSRVFDKDVFRAYYLSEIEFIEHNKFGVGEGLNSPNGSVRIYTKKSPNKPFDQKTTQAYNFPLKFSPNKTFYTPKYKYYNDDFYKNFGVIDWQPNLKVDNANNISFKIAQPKVPVTLHIEGIANDGSYVFEKKAIPLN